MGWILLETREVPDRLVKWERGTLKTELLAPIREGEAPKVLWDFCSIEASEVLG